MEKNLKTIKIFQVITFSTSRPHSPESRDRLGGFLQNIERFVCIGPLVV